MVLGLPSKDSIMADYIVPQRTMDKLVEFLQEQAPVKLLNILQSTVKEHKEPEVEEKNDG